jgi:hypothetical protein
MPDRRGHRRRDPHHAHQPDHALLRMEHAVSHGTPLAAAGAVPWVARSTPSPSLVRCASGRRARPWLRAHDRTGAARTLAFRTALRLRRCCEELRRIVAHTSNLAASRRQRTGIVGSTFQVASCAVVRVPRTTSSRGRERAQGTQPRADRGEQARGSNAAMVYRPLELMNSMISSGSPLMSTQRAYRSGPKRGFSRLSTRKRLLQYPSMSRNAIGEAWPKLS